MQQNSYSLRSNSNTWGNLPPREPLRPEPRVFVCDILWSNPTHSIHQNFHSLSLGFNHKISHQTLSQLAPSQVFVCVMSCGQTPCNRILPTNPNLTLRQHAPGRIVCVMSCGQTMQQNSHSLRTLITVTRSVVDSTTGLDGDKLKTSPPTSGCHAHHLC